MSSLNEQGPQRLEEQSIGAEVTFNVPRNYALGHTGKKDDHFDGECVADPTPTRTAVLRSRSTT